MLKLVARCKNHMRHISELNQINFAWLFLHFDKLFEDGPIQSITASENIRYL